MIKNIIIALFLLVSWGTNAVACSIYAETRKGAFSYERLVNTSYQDGWTYESPDASNYIKLLESDIDRNIRSGRIFIARPKFVEIEATSDSLESLPLGLIKFKPKVHLQGADNKPHWFAEDREVFTPVIDPKKLPKDLKHYYAGFLEMVETQVESHKHFEFWDDQIILKQRMIFPPHETSCGVSYVPTFDFNRDYIVFESDYGRSTYIPIDNDEDKFLLELQSALRSKPKKLRATTSAKSYFSQMKYAIPFKLSSCSSKLTRSNLGKDGWWDPYSAFNQTSNNIFERGAKFRPLKKDDANKSAFKAISGDWPALFSYYADRDQRGIECGKSQEFLVFGYQTVGESASRNNWSQIQSSGGDFGTSAYRFAKIVDGKVLPSSIHTNYLFEDYTSISLDTVLSWVKEGDYDPNHWNNIQP